MLQRVAGVVAAAAAPLVAANNPPPASQSAEASAAMMHVAVGNAMRVMGASDTEMSGMSADDMMEMMDLKMRIKCAKFLGYPDEDENGEFDAIASRRLQGMNMSHIMSHKNAAQQSAQMAATSAKMGGLYQFATMSMSGRTPWTDAQLTEFLETGQTS